MVMHDLMKTMRQILFSQLSKILKSESVVFLPHQPQNKIGKFCHFVLLMVVNYRLSRLE